MSLTPHVTVSIVARNKGVSRTGFGIQLIAHYHTLWPERVRAYSGVQAMIDDGATAGDAAVLAASRIFAQNPSPELVKIGRMATAPVAHVERLVPTVVAGVTYTLELADSAGVITTFEYTADTSDDAESVCAALAVLIEAGTLDITAAEDPDTSEAALVLTGDVAGEVFYCHATDDQDGSLWARTCSNADPGIATDLAAILSADSDFYGLVVTNPAQACQVAAAAWALTNRKLFACTSGNSDCRVGTAGSLTKAIKAASNDHAFAFYSARPQEFVAAGIMARMFALDPGRGTWAYKTVLGATADVLSDTHKGNIEGDNANWHCDVGGIVITFPGKTGSGQYNDDTHSIDWLCARIQESVYAAQVNNEKIPYDERGAMIIETAIRGPLQVAANNDVIDNDFVINVPAASTLTTADKAAREWPGITFSATLLGSAHKIIINGTLSL